jgi:hypothetical protein
MRYPDLPHDGKGCAQAIQSPQPLHHGQHHTCFDAVPSADTVGAGETDKDPSKVRAGQASWAARSTSGNLRGAIAKGQ